ncbi:MAG: FAD-binding protein [Candidatus Pacebacteria bacterium]|nr:FAD-binding protein [Candidatus Paceibacterota bacterium]
MSIEIQKNISLSKYTSFKIGGPAMYFCVVENNDEIKEALEFAEKNKLKIFVLGGGSNLLISDKGFDGLVIRITNYELRIKNNEIFVGSGLSLAKLVNESVKNNLTGLEWAMAIPGTVGGAIANNAGANGMSMSDVVEEVEVLEITPQPPLSGGLSSSPDKGRLGGVRRLTNKQCNFLYRNSIFKEEKNYIILSVVMRLKKGSEKESREIMLKYTKNRTAKQPLKYPNAGSIFKNPEVDDKHLEDLIEKYPELANIAKNNIIPAGWLIEQINELKSKKIGGAMISEKHCNFIVNFNNAKSEDVVILTSLIKQKVRNRLGIQLKEEIEYVGF